MPYGTALCLGSKRVGDLFGIAQRLLVHRYFVFGGAEDFSEHMPAHLLCLLEAIDVQNGRRNVVHARAQPHQPEVTLDTRPHRKERAGNVIAIRKIVLGNDRCSLLVVHVCVRIFLLELAQWLNAVVRKD